MLLEIEDFSSATGWTTSDATKIKIHGVNQIPEFIAGPEKTSSLIIQLLADSNGAYLEKAISPAVDVSEYTKITFNVQSINQKNKGVNFQDADNFLLQIDLNGTMTDIMIPIYNQMHPVTFSLSGITSIDRVRITSNTNTAGYFVFSYMVAVKDQLPLDIFKGMKSLLEEIRDDKADKIISLGTITALTGDTSIEFTANPYYLDRYALILIDDGVNTEIHQIDENNELEYSFNSMYDGRSLLHDYTNANVYLYFPVEYNLLEQEIFLPGIVISGITPKPFFRGPKSAYQLDTFKEDGSVMSRKDDMYTEWNITIDCEARNLDLIAIMSEIVRIAIGRETLWILGQKHSMFFATDPVYIEPTEGYNQVPKIQFIVKVETKEEIWDRETLPKTTAITRTYTIE